jgi:hypothetical protein
MKIIFDGLIYSLQKQGGISRYFDELINGLAERPDCDISVLIRKDQINKEALENENSDNNSDKTSFKRKELDLQKEGWNFGIPPNIFKWLKRLFWILFLLGLFFSFTKYGKKLICSIQRYYYDNNRLSLEKEGKRLEGIIERTRPKKSKCGSQIDFNGASLPQQYIYTLGTTSGDVEINYDMFTVPDRIEVSYNGKAVAQT